MSADQNSARPATRFRTALQGASLFTSGWSLMFSGIFSMNGGVASEGERRARLGEELMLRAMIPR